MWVPKIRHDLLKSESKASYRRQAWLDQEQDL